MEALLKYSENLNPKLKTIVTVSVRHVDSMKRIKCIMKVAENHDNVGLNLVAGNKVYLTKRELERPIIKTLMRAVNFVTRRFEDNAIFVGVEGMTNTISKLISEYEITPFLLLDRSLKADIDKIRKIKSECPMAIYAPYLVFTDGNDASDEIINRLLDYALRRKWVQETLMEKGYDSNQVYALLQRGQKENSQTQHQRLKETLTGIIGQLSIFGNEQTINRTLQMLREADIIVGLPVKEEEGQVKQFASIIKNFNGF